MSTIDGPTPLSAAPPAGHADGDHGADASEPGHSTSPTAICRFCRKNVGLNGPGGGLSMHYDSGGKIYCPGSHLKPGGTQRDYA